ncbi:MAG: 4Fe-4S dicluster domain-containing protein [Bacteroidales bacterium]|nr:4Fe-4S dicluster domain-containing protein [Bacteroidales bacterium]
MNKAIKINREEWNRLLLQFSESGESIYAPVRKNGSFDYEHLERDNIGEIVYNEARPASPLKIFFLPLRLNVTAGIAPPGRTIVIGPPACDIEGLKLLDAMYIDEKYTDETYLSRRNSTIIIGAACHKTAEHCHCTTYGLNPWPGEGCDVSMSLSGEDILLEALSEKGRDLLTEISGIVSVGEPGTGDISFIEGLRKSSADEVAARNRELPGTEATGRLTAAASHDFWKKQSARCVSCGACSAICPTCTCFLLIDKPGFEKIKQQDTCQYPAFERVAGGEDPLKELSVRFHNRYMCKYVWKPERFKVLACTGCGRCTDACIAGISKNKVIMEMV